MKKGIGILSIFVILGVVFFIGAFFWWSSNSSPVSPSEEEVSFLIPKGRGASQVGVTLEEEGLIKSALAFKIYVQLNDKSQSINAGEFSLSPNMSVSEIVTALGKGPKELWVTIPEGLRREQIVELFMVGLEKEGVEAEVFRNDFLLQTSEREGYVYPDTYLLPREVTAMQVVKLVDATFDKRLEEFQTDIDLSGLSLDEIIILASLVEKETKTDAERSVVAGIILKRIEADWTPDIDATVQYGVANRTCGIDSSFCDDWWPILTRDDIDVDSPYNSYLNQGLPPTPIANPGISSIKAAVYPEKSPYWFYIHDSDGIIRYGKTLEEHNANIAKYLR